MTTIARKGVRRIAVVSKAGWKLGHCPGEGDVMLKIAAVERRLSDTAAGSRYQRHAIAMRRGEMLGRLRSSRMPSPDRDTSHEGPFGGGVTLLSPHA